MHAYVFWHWPRAEAAGPAYDGALAEFHRALAGAGAAWLRGSAVFRGRGLPWLATASWGYEDWYLLDGSFALDALNDLAVSGARQPAHDRAAAAADGGSGGLYRLRAGVPDLPAARVAAWFGKPAGIAYEPFLAELRPWTEQAGVSLWMRQMVLGPAREFCLRSPASLALPSSLAAHVADMETVWPPATPRGSEPRRPPL